MLEEKKMLTFGIATLISAASGLSSISHQHQLIVSSSAHLGFNLRHWVDYRISLPGIVLGRPFDCCPRTQRGDGQSLGQGSGDPAASLEWGYHFIGLPWPLSPLSVSCRADVGGNALSGRRRFETRHLFPRPSLLPSATSISSIRSRTRWAARRQQRASAPQRRGRASTSS